MASAYIYAYTGGDPVNKADPTGDDGALAKNVGVGNSPDANDELNNKPGSDTSGDARTAQAAKTCGWPCTDAQAAQQNRVTAVANSDSYLAVPVLAPVVAALAGLAPAVLAVEEAAETAIPQLAANRVSSLDRNQR